MNLIVFLLSIVFAAGAVILLPWQLLEQRRTQRKLQAEGGTLLLDLGRQALSPGLLIVLAWGAATVSWTFLTFYVLVRQGGVPEFDLVPIVLFPIAFLLMFLYLVSVDWRKLEAREHGLLDSRNLISWQDIHGYNWKGRRGNVLEIWIGKESRLTENASNPLRLYVAPQKRPELEQILKSRISRDSIDEGFAGKLVAP